MKENEINTINGDLNENIIQTDIDYGSSVINDPSSSNQAKSKKRVSLKKSPTEILSELNIISIVPYNSTTNEVLGIKNTKNEDIIIFEITGQNLVSSISWKIYKTPKQVRELFNQTRKELSKKNIITDEITNICKSVNDYTFGEIYKNMDKIIIIYWSF